MQVNMITVLGQSTVLMTVCTETQKTVTATTTALTLN